MADLFDKNQLKEAAARLVATAEASDLSLSSIQSMRTAYSVKLADQFQHFDLYLQESSLFYIIKLINIFYAISLLKFNFKLYNFDKK